MSKNGGPGRTRTSDQWTMSPLLKPTELQALLINDIELRTSNYIRIYNLGKLLSLENFLNTLLLAND